MNNYLKDKGEVIREAYQQGYDAAKNGLTENDNPYGDNWLIGYVTELSLYDECQYEWREGFRKYVRSANPK